MSRSSQTGTPHGPVEVAIALDVGGTSIKAGLVTRAGEILLEARRPTKVEQGIPTVINGMVDLVGDLKSEADALGLRALTVGVIVPGVVDSVTGVARKSANISWNNDPIAAIIGAAIELPVTLGHDVRTAAIAEDRFGAGRDASSMFFISVGTGLAAGYVRNSVIDDGATGQAGEFGHIVIRPDGPPCGCGNRGCVEVYSAASRIAAAYAAQTGKPSTAKDVAEQVELGEPIAQAIWAAAVEALAEGVAGVVSILDPEIVVFGGGLSLAGSTLLKPLEVALNARLSFRTAPPLVATILGDRAGLIGAGIRAWDRLDLTS